MLINPSDVGTIPVHGVGVGEFFTSLKVKKKSSGGKDPETLVLEFFCLGLSPSKQKNTE